MVFFFQKNDQSFLWERTLLCGSYQGIYKLAGQGCGTHPSRPPGYIWSLEEQGKLSRAFQARVFWKRAGRRHSLSGQRCGRHPADCHGLHLKFRGTRQASSPVSVRLCKQCHGQMRLSNSYTD